MRSKLPEHYPTNQHCTSTKTPKFRSVINMNRLQPVEITYDWLKQGYKFCFHTVYHGMWNIQSATAYMKSLGIKPEFGRIHVIDVARKLRIKEVPNETDIFQH